jgi:hypothetical protein
MVLGGSLNEIDWGFIDGIQSIFIFSDVLSILAF